MSQDAPTPEPIIYRLVFAGLTTIRPLTLIGGQTGTLWGVHYLPAGVASVFGSAPSLFLALFAWLLLHQPLGKWQLVGVGIGFAGIALMGWTATAVGFQPSGAIAVLAAGAVWAGGSLLQSRVQTPEAPIINLTVQLLVAGLLLWLLVWMTGTTDQVNLAKLPHRAWIAIALCKYWRDRYDWCRCETMLNGWNPQRTVIDGCGIHFFQVPSPEPDALPAIVTHG